MTRSTKRPSDAELHALAEEMMRENGTGEIFPRRFDQTDLRPATSDPLIAPRHELSRLFVKSLTEAHSCENYLLSNTRSMLQFAKSEALVLPLQQVEEISREHYEMLTEILIGLSLHTNEIKRPSALIWAWHQSVDVNSELSDWAIYTNQQTALSHQAMLYRMASVYAYGLSLSDKWTARLTKSAEEVRRTQDLLDRSFNRMPRRPEYAWHL